MSDTKQVIVVRKDLNMRKGKIAAQASHASMSFITRRLKGPFPGEGEFSDAHHEVTLSHVEQEWLASSYAKIVVSADTEQELLDLISKAKSAGIEVHEVIDSGRTEFNGVPTRTCAAFGPDRAARLDPITGGLKLL